MLRYPDVPGAISFLKQKHLSYPVLKASRAVVANSIIVKKKIPSDWQSLKPYTSHFIVHQIAGLMSTIISIRFTF